jgi:transposase
MGQSGTSAEAPISARRKRQIFSLIEDLEAHTRECYPHDHFSASGAISPEGNRYFHGQDGALNSEAVVAFFEHLRREVPGRMVVSWDGAPIHRSHVIREFLAQGAAQRIPLERLPAYAPELNPGEGLWQQRKGVELHNLCCFNIPHLRGERRDAVKRVRRHHT